MDPGTITPDPHFWDYFWRIVHILGASAILIVGWIWARLNQHESVTSMLKEKLDTIEKEIIMQRMEIHKDFVTKTELRSIVHDAIEPIKDKIDHIETLLDKLVHAHLRVDMNLGDDPIPPTPRRRAAS